MPDLPEEYEYLNNYRLATFLQDREDKTRFKIKFIPVNGGNTDLVNGNEPYEMLCTGKEKEKLEMLMIAHPKYSIRGTSSLITEFDETLWNAIVDRVTVTRDGGMIFHFKNGSEVRVL